MRVVSWNIERGYNPDAIVQELRDLAADVYLLYELDRGVRRTHGVDLFARIRDGLGLHSRYVREFSEIDTIWRRIIPWGGPGGGEIGNAIFSRSEIQDYRVVDLPMQPPLLYQRTTYFPELFQPRAGCRKGQVFKIQTDAGAIAIAGAHLELFRSGWTHRRRQLDAIRAGLDDDAIIFAGDFNNVGGSVRATCTRTPGTGEVREVREWLKENGLADPFKDTDTTCGRFGVNAKIDWLAGTENLKVKAVRIGRTALSDHAWLAVDYEMSSIGAETRSQSSG